MIDPSLREQRLLVEAADPAVGVLLIDVVLGHGAHADPASSLGPTITSALAAASADDRGLAVVVSLTGTRGDPQGLPRQATELAAAGAHVFLSNAEATRFALSQLPSISPLPPAGEQP
jgi:FdrA protein